MACCCCWFIHPATEITRKRNGSRLVCVFKTYYRETWVKMDAHQPTGSFKIRGVGLLCQRLQAEGAERFACSSGGNAGLAAAYAARAIGAPMTVVLPSTTPGFMRERIAALGADVLIEGDVWDAADALAQAIAGRGEAA